MIICFAAHKGGVGKTTSSINVASGLARAGQATLLVDLDPQGHSSIGLGVEVPYDAPTIADVLGDRPTTLDKIVHITAVPGLTLLPSNLRLAALAESLYSKVRREERLTKALSRRTHNYEWIVIDCPPALNVLTINAVEASDLILIPCPMGARALDGLEDLLDLVRLLKPERFDAWRILLTMFDPRKSITREFFEDMLRTYEGHVLTTRIFTNEALNQSQMARQDIFTYDPRSRGALNYQELTKELLGCTR
jgi:chromosome partitioning protein